MRTEETPLSIEFEPPTPSRCDCCGELTVALTRFVYKAGDAFAIYYGRYANAHPDDGLDVLISLGEWDDDSTPEQRVAFYCQLQLIDDTFSLTLGDADKSAWSHAEVAGKKLSRKEALRHPWKQDVFELVDTIYARDPSISGYFHRASCGDTEATLERNHGLPDVVFALEPKEQQARVKASAAFATLDDNRFFLRCLLPFRVANRGLWNVGVWVEVNKLDHDRACHSWDDSNRYRQLRFGGELANDLNYMGIDANAQTPVEVAVVNPDSPPQVIDSRGTSLGERLKNEWAESAFVTYAIEHGFL